MEDVIVLDEMMQKYPDDRLRAFEQYSKKRNPDAEAMCDLAMYNYIEVGCKLVFGHLNTKRQNEMYIDIW